MIKINNVSRNLKAKKVALATVGALTVLTPLALTGCQQQVEQNTSEVEISQDNTENLTEEQKRILELEQRIAELEKQQGTTTYGENDTYEMANWEAFLAECNGALDGVINNADADSICSAVTILNIDFLDANAKQVLIDHFSAGQDMESELNNLYSLLSQVREYNTELDSSEKYFSYSDIMLDDLDKAVISVLDDYAKEVIDLRNSDKKEDLERVEKIFDLIDKFSKGEAKIDVVMNGKAISVAQIDLSHGGIFAAENIAQDISVLSKDIVSQDKRESLDEALRSRDTLAKTQELMKEYLSKAEVLTNVESAEEQAKIVETYNKGLAIISSELEVMGISAEEANSLYTLANIDYFMDGINSQNALAQIYSEGFNINDMFNNAESAVSKIVEYNDSTGTTYDMARLFMASKTDAVSLRVFTQEAQRINTEDKGTVEEVVNTVKGYSQFSADVTVNYTEKLEDGTKVEHKLDKNALSKGAYQICNFYTYYSVNAHKLAYGGMADAILPLVDGSAYGLDPYEQLVLMVEDQCANSNLVVYDYEMGNLSK